MSKDLRDLVTKAVKETSRGVIVEVYVKPESNRDELVVENGELVFYTEEPPIRGRANASLVRFFSRILGIQPGYIEIVYGARERVKRLLIRGISLDTVIDKIVEKASRQT